MRVRERVRELVGVGFGVDAESLARVLTLWYSPMPLSTMAATSSRPTASLSSFILRHLSTHWLLATSLGPTSIRSGTPFRSHS